MKTSQQRVTRWTLVILVAASAGACSRSDQPPAHESATQAGARATGHAEAPAPLPVDAAPSPLEQLLAITNVDDAIEKVRPEMTDTDDETSPGAVMFTVWAAAHLRWSDVAVRRNETSFALVHKDSDAARGKRMCTRGAIIQIEKEELGDTKVFSGLLLSGYSHILSFFAVGSTGELVERSYARFCGVVIGTYDYSNAAAARATPSARSGCSTSGRTATQRADALRDSRPMAEPTLWTRLC